MIILGTNVLSELMKLNPSPAFVSWAESNLSAELFIATITQAEIRYGIELLFDGKGENNQNFAAIMMFEEHNYLQMCITCPFCGKVALIVPNKKTIL